MKLLEQLSAAIQKGKDKESLDLTGQAITANLGAKMILNEGLLSAMTVIGDKFGRREIFLPEVLLAARAMQAGLSLLRPLLVKDNVPAIGKVVMGTVKGDIHDLGKNLVIIMLQGAGFEVIDLGKDVAPDEFLAKAIEHEASIIGLSALLTTTMPTMKEVVELIKTQGYDGRIKTVVGGAPVTEQSALAMGADAYAYDAANAVQVIKNLAGIA